MSQSSPVLSTQVVILGAVTAVKDGLQSLIDLMSAHDACTYVLSDFTYSDPIALTEQNAVVDILIDPVTRIKSIIVRNTRIFLTPKDGIGTYGPKIVYYDRIHVSELTTMLVTKGGATTIYEVLAKLNYKTGLNIGEEDIFDGTLPSASIDGNTHVILNIKPTSLVFYGSVKISAIDYQCSEHLAIVPVGTVFGTYCQGSNLMKIVANGRGGVSIIIAELNSVACQVPSPFIAKGEIFAEYCVGRELRRAVADGGGGVIINVHELNSDRCPVPTDNTELLIALEHQVRSLVEVNITLSAQLNEAILANLRTALESAIVVTNLPGFKAE